MSNKFLLRQILRVGGSFFVGASIAIGTLCPIVLDSSRALADDRHSPNIPTDAQNKLATLFWQGINAKTIAFTPNGEWVILYNKNEAYWSNNFPLDVANTIRYLNKQGSIINTIAFTPSGEWVIIYNGYDAYWSNNVSQDVKYAIVQINQEKYNINSVAFTPDGEWVIIYGGNSYYPSKNFPLDTFYKIISLKYQHSTINSVAFDPNGGWAILYDNNGHASNGISQAATDAIVASSNIGDGLINIAFTPSNGYVLLFSPSLAQLQQYQIEQQAYQGLLF